jgi:hypothetical protein
VWWQVAAKITFPEVFVNCMRMSRFQIVQWDHPTQGLGQLPQREQHFSLCFDAKKEKLGLSPLAKVQEFGC